jgi:hypothetical protein
MTYYIEWKLPNGHTEQETFADLGDAKIEATYRANKFAIEHGSCEILITDETGQAHLIQTNSYHG